MKMISDKIKKTLKRYQITIWIIVLIVIISSQIINHSKISYALIAIGVSIFLTSILTVWICPKYNGSYNFVMGTIIGIMVSLYPSLILRDIQSDTLWVWILIFSWIFGGYLSVKDQVKLRDDILDMPIAVFLAIGGVMFGTLVGLLGLSIIVSFIFALFSMSVEFLHSIIISFIIINLALVEFLSKKIFHTDLDKVEYKPNVYGIFGAFIGGITGLTFSSIVGYLCINIDDITINNFWVGPYSGLVAGVILGFFIGYQIERMTSKSKTK